MKFGLASDSSDEDDLQSLASSFTSDENESSEAGPSRPRATSLSQFGRSIKAFIDSSSEDDDFEEVVDSEEEDIFRPDVITIGAHSSSHSHSQAKAPRRPKRTKNKGKMKSPPRISWGCARRDAETMQELLGAEEDGMMGVDWAKVTEEMALQNPEDAEMQREGQRIARERNLQLQRHLSSTRAELREEQGMRDSAAADEISKLLQGIALRNSKEEEEAAKRFAEREKRLWADIDKAIALAEQKASDARRAVLDAEEKKKAEAAAKVAAETKAAEDRQAEAQRLAREAVEKSQRDKEAARKLEEERQKVEQAKAERSATQVEWNKWVEEQARMKRDVIEVVKNGGKAKLRAGMRLITRGLGQVVNSRESVVKLTEELCGILNPLLPSPPTPAAPTTMSSPPPYLYLLSHTAKALIKQAENEIAAKSEAAFPIAGIVVGLLLRGHAALSTILFARLNKKCPWVIPYYPSRKPNQPRGEYEKSTGQGSDESTADYIVRMGGILTLYFSILQIAYGPLINTLPTPPTPERLAELVIPPLRLPAAWTWISHILKDPLRSTPAAAHLVNVWASVASPELAKVYGPGQVGKVLRAIKEEGIDGGLIKGDAESSRQQLGLAVEQWRAGEYPKGRVWE